MPRPSWKCSTVAMLAALASAGFAAEAPVSSAAERWTWPVRGSVITPYSNDNSRPYAGGMHRGIDIAAPVGTDVAAAKAGRVTFSGALGSAGLTVAIATADALHVTSYLHLKTVAVGRGEYVDIGQKVGEVGTSGRRSATKPHLHFGVRLAGRKRVYVDPLTLLPATHTAKPGAPPAPVSAPAWPASAPVRVRPAPRPAPVRPRRPALRPVPIGPRATTHPVRNPDPVVAPRHPAPRVAAGEEPPGISWGPPVSLAGLLLLGAVLARRLRREGSGAVRGEDRAEPSPRPSTVAVPRVRSVPHVG